MKTKEQIEKAYNSLIRLVKKNKELIDLDLRDLEFKKKRDLLILELNAVGFDVRYIYDIKYQELYNHWFYYVDFAKENGYSISWSDNGEQPVNERLIKLSFSTGAYIFGEHYDTKTFNEFFQDLKLFGFKYLDSANKSIYYDLETGGMVYKVFKGMYKKYYELSQERDKQRKIESLKQELQKLEN